MYVLGTYVRDVMKLNMESRNFRIFAPDETASNRLQAVFEVTGRRFLDQQIPGIDAIWTRTAGSWTPCSPSISARAFWRAIF